MAKSEGEGKAKSKDFFFVNKKEAAHGGEAARGPVSKSFLRAFFQKSAFLLSSSSLA